MIALQPMQQTMDDAELFIVRVWRHLSQFRASVRRVDADEPCLCTTPEQVAQALAWRPGADGGPHDGPGPEHRTPTDPRRSP